MRETSRPLRRQIPRPLTRPNDVWHLDLTAVPTAGGFWLPYFPYAKVQRWPFCWWVAVCVDHASRRLVGFAVFFSRPTSLEVSRFLGRVVSAVGPKPRYILTDSGKEFRGAFVTWCRRHGIRLRRGAVGRHGSICVVERFIRSLKNECMRRILVPFRLAEMRRELVLYSTWYNEHRPHAWLGGRTPEEVYRSQPPANASPRFEPRPRWPRGVGKRKGPAGVRLALCLGHYANRRHLPLVGIRRAV